MTRTCRALVVGKATVSRWYAKLGVVTNPKHNGVALKGKGYRFRPERRKHDARLAIFRMEKRVKRCLNKRPPSPTRGMSDAERFRWNYHNCPEKRIYELLRRRMKKVIKDGVKRGRSLELIGCSSAHVRAHLESQFRCGMDWTNMGTGKGLWHIDHIIPCAAFDLTREDQQRICFHWTNLRPMWSLLNIAKGKKLEASQTPCFI
jgi:hypothetical protein